MTISTEDLGMYGIVRINYEKTVKGWRVRVGRSKSIDNVCTDIKDSDYDNNSGKSLLAAIKLRNKTYRDITKLITGFKPNYHPPRSDRIFHKKMSTRNTSGRIGVFLHSKEVNGTLYFNYVTHFCYRKGKKLSKNFAVLKYSEKGAYTLACMQRDEWEQQYGYGGKTKKPSK